MERERADVVEREIEGTADIAFDDEPVVGALRRVDDPGGSGRTVDRESLRSGVGSPRREQRQLPERPDGLADGEQRQHARRARDEAEEATPVDRRRVGRRRRRGRVLSARRAIAWRVVASLAPTCTISAPMVIHATQ